MTSIDIEPPHRSRKSGKELFSYGTQPVDFDLCKFWQWSTSDLLNNTTRGLLAEFIVAKALGVADGVRREWDTFDLRSQGATAIEVKSCAYVQSWKQTKSSPITFVIRKTRALDDASGLYSQEMKRQAGIYIFAVLAHTSKETIDSLNLQQWEFYPVLTSALDARTRSQHSITLNSLKMLCQRCSYSELAAAIRLLEHSTNNQ